VAVLPNMPTVTPLIYLVAAIMSMVACVVSGVCAWRHSGEGRHGGRAGCSAAPRWA
jgi:hypothetical protein